MAPVTLEICFDVPDGLRAASEGGADRIALCAAPALGGLTPAPRLVALAALAGVVICAARRGALGPARA